MQKSLRHHTYKEFFYHEENFRTILNSALEGFYLLNMEGQILDANDSYCSMIGYSHDELLNMKIKDIEVVDSEEVIKKRIQRISEKGSDRFETKHKRKDGSFIFIEANIRYVKDEQGKLSVFMRDITERKQAEEAVYTSEALNRAVLNSVLANIAVVDKHGTIIAINEGWERFAQENGCDPQSLKVSVGANYLEVCERAGVGLDEEAQAVSNGIKAVLAQSQATFKHEYPCDSPTEQRWFSMQVSHLNRAEGGAVIAHFNNTEHRQMEDALQESEQMLHNVLENFPGVVFWKDTQSNYLGCNYSFAAGAGLNSSIEIIGKTDFDLPWSATEIANYRADDYEVMQSGKAKLHIVETQHQINDHMIWLDTSKIPLRDSKGQVIGVMGVSTDITERKQAEAELVVANKELLFQNEEKEKRAAELLLANKELAFQNDEKEKRAIELLLANKELAFQNDEKEKRAAELLLANKELAFQNDEKEKRAIELLLANKELAFQNDEKEKRAAELLLANKELAFQNDEKEKRAAELLLANKELAFQNEEKEKRAAELVLANEDIVCRLQNIQALHKIDQAVVGSLDLNLTLHVVLEQAKAELHVCAAAILLFNPYSQILEFAAGIGFRSKAIERSRLRLGEGLGGRAALEERTTSIIDLPENSDQFVRAPLLAGEEFITYFSTPLIVKGQVKGVLEVFHRSPFIPDQDWLDFLEVLAGQTAIAVDSATLLANLQRSNRELFNAYDSTIEGWSHALDLRDKETEGHTQRVTEMTMKLARAAEITEEELVHVRRGALLHDIGKMGVPDYILLKPDKLTDEEWVTMRKHPFFAFELLSPISYLRPALDIPYCHHEKWDGSGYPRGLKGEQIPLATRLFSIIDVWDALRSDRPYRQGWSKEKVIEHIKSLSGTHFEPKAVELFLNMINEDD